MPTVHVEKDRCKGCELCTQVCPKQVLVMSKDINAKGYFFPEAANPDQCNGCRHCALMCPDEAIQVEVKGKVSSSPDALTGKPLHYCPGCTHGVIHSLIAEAIDFHKLKETTVGIAPVGCSVLAYEYFDVDMQQASHGRALALATGIKRGRPDLTVFTYQGDGDLASIGMAETIHAANRGEKVTAFFVNNGIYGMTGGQMAPTTLPGQITSTSRAGRDTGHAGEPIGMVELLKELKTPAYLTRVSVHDPKHVMQARKAIRKALKHQMDGTCFSFVEILSTCPTGWGQTPYNSCGWVVDKMMPVFPLGDFKVPEAA